MISHQYHGGRSLWQIDVMTSSNGNIFRVTGHLCQWRGALMFSLICAWINDWVNNREAGDLRRYLAHSDAIVMTIDVIACSGEQQKKHQRSPSLVLCNMKFPRKVLIIPKASPCYDIIINWCWVDSRKSTLILAELSPCGSELKPARANNMLFDVLVPFRAR